MPKRDSPAYVKLEDISKFTGFTVKWLCDYYRGLCIKPSGHTLDSGYSKRKRKTIAPTRNHKSVKI